MRNLIEYPILHDEIIDNLKEVIAKTKEQNREIIPDMESYLLEAALIILESKNV